MSTVIQRAELPSSQRRASVVRFVRRHPITAFLIGAYGVGGTLLTIFTVVPLPPNAHTAVGLAFTYVGLLGSAVAVTWVIGGKSAVLRFLARFLLWRFGVARWVYILLALPALTTVLAAVSGTLQRPSDGWAALALTFFLHTLVTGALEVNIAEEGAWSGFVQSRLTDRHGILGGALRTSPLFVTMHVPLQFAAGWTWSSVMVGVIVLSIMAPFFRYLLGETLTAAGGSLLAAGILHASFNASQQLGYPGEWQFLPAMMILAVSAALLRRFGPGTHRG